MIRISVLILATFFSCALFSQDTLNVTDGKGLRQGSWRKVDSAGRLIYTGRFVNGIPSGEFRYYYPDGKLKTVSFVSDHGKKAAVLSYFPGGRKMAAGNYLNEKKDSIWQFYSEITGSLVSQEFYRAGRIDGPSEVFFSEGGLSEVYHYKNGTKEGLWEQYYLDGKLKLRGLYKEGEKQGPFKTFYNSGLPMMEGQYIQGHQQGTWTYYNEKGVVLKKELYETGKLIKVYPPF